MTTRTALACLLLTLSLTAGFGAAMAFLIGRECAREEQLQRMARLDPSFPLTRIVDDPGIRWVEEGRELWIEGRLHDVVGTETSGGLRVYLAIPDDRETELLDRYLERSGGMDGSGKGYRMPVTNLFSNVWMPAQFPDDACPIILSRVCMTASGPISLGNAPFLPVPFPPPLG